MDQVLPVWRQAEEQHRTETPGPDSAAARREDEDHYRFAIEHNPNLLWTADADGIVEEIGPRWQALVGDTLSEPINDSWSARIHQDDRLYAETFWELSVQTGEAYDVEYRFRVAGGDFRWFHTRAIPRYDSAGRILRWYGTTADIHDRKIMEIGHQESEQRLRLAMAVGQMGAWEIDPEARTITLSDQCAINLGLPPSDEPLNLNDFILCIHPDDRHDAKARLEHCLAAHIDLVFEQRIYWPDGTLHWVKGLGRNVIDDATHTHRMVGLNQDITEFRRAEEERAKAEAEMSYLAFHDHLTGLANRRSLHSALEKVVADGLPNLALLCIDLDKFGAINDSLGHRAGDQILVDAAHLIRQVVDPVAVVARYGGDEFAVLLVDVTREQVVATAKAILSAFEKPFLLSNGSQITVAASIGISMSQDAEAPLQMLPNADTALYRAKTSGRSRYHVFTACSDVVLQDRQFLLLSLRDALSLRQFKLVYQPLINLSSGRLTSAEALLRWEHPTRGTVSPADFIPLTEETGLIVSIGRWVLEEACLTAATWPSHVSVTVNLSSVQFTSGDLLADVASALEKSGLAPHQLEVEITETLLLHDIEATTATLQALRTMGIRISMDDFGTGYSSLAYLGKFPFTKIKIDKSLINGLQDLSGGSAIVRAIIGLGQSLGMATTAEGVETQEQLKALLDMRCTEIQGYLMSRPVTPDILETLIGKRWLPGPTACSSDI